MDINLLAISVGNTRTHLGVFVEGELIDWRHIDNDAMAELPGVLRDLFAHIRNASGAVVYLASVNDPVADPIADMVDDELHVPVLRIEHDVRVPIGRQLDRETIVGDDRLLNAACAYDTLKQACIVVDAGTAVTVDFVDGAGTFHGGAILPGAQMMLNALHHNTAQLPQLTFQPPEDAIGHNTAQAMLDGVFHGVRGAVRELVEKYAEVYGAYPRVVATGGDAHTLFDGYDLIDTIVPNLTLLGIAVTHRLYEAAEDAEG